MVSCTTANSQIANLIPRLLRLSTMPIEVILKLSNNLFMSLLTGSMRESKKSKKASKPVKQMLLHRLNNPNMWRRKLLLKLNHLQHKLPMIKRRMILSFRPKNSVYQVETTQI